MTDRTQPDSGRATGAAHIIRYALELGLLWIDGDGRDKVREALDALDALEAKLASIGAGGVQALSAAPAGPNGDELRRIARSARTSASDDASPTEYVLAGWKAAMLAASHPVEQHAQPGAVYAELPLSVGEHKYGGGLFTEAQMRDFADRTHALRMEQAALKAAPGLPMQERPQENTLVWVADPTSSTGVKGFFADSVPCPWWYKAGLVFLREGDAAALGKSMRAVALSVPKAAPGESRWWRKRADEIEAQVALTGSPDAMRCFTDMRTLLQDATDAAPGDALDEVMRERDEAEDFINELLDEVLGADRPEWSSAYNRYDAMSDVRERITALHKPAVDKAWGQFQSAMAAPQPAPAPLSEQDPLQGAANWLAQAHGQFCVSVLQGCLMIGHNRAKRLHDAAIAAQGGKV